MSQCLGLICGLEAKITNRLLALDIKNKYNHQRTERAEKSDEVAALKTYACKTIKLAFEGREQFVKNYPSIEKEALTKIKIDHDANYLFRTIFNIITVALSTISVVGLVAMAATSKNRGGFLLLRAPEEKTLSKAAALLINAM